MIFALEIKIIYMSVIKTSLLLVLLCLFFNVSIKAQSDISTAQKMEQAREQKFSFGGYGQLDYNQRVSSSKRYAGVLDPHRVVLFMGYQFSPKIHLVSEFEVEHGNEFYVEQAYINFRLNSKIQMRGGIMLIPMGITNEYHEPTLFNGVERPSIASVIIPTTWREIGVGIHGRIRDASLSYQAYLFNGFNGYDTKARLTGKDGLRKGRQKAINSYITSPNVSAKVDYYGITNLNIGLAGYFGKSQSKMFDKMDKSSDSEQSKADSSTVNISMIGLDFKYQPGALELRGEYIHTFVGNTKEYNSFNGQSNDLASSMRGWYVEASYDLLFKQYSGQRRLVPFIRFESYDTHYKVVDIERNRDYAFNEFFAGIGFSPVRGVVLKADYQIRHNRGDSNLDEHRINMGIGFAF